MNITSYGGNTPLISCCLRAYNSGSSASASELDVTKKDRFACVKQIIETGCDVNKQSNIVKMTALHWAAYNNDAKVCKYLIEHGALQLLNSDNNAPVDIAAIRENWDVVRVFCDEFNKRVNLKKVPAPQTTPLKIKP